MRDFHLPGRSPVHGLNAMAATSHPAATLAAIDTLRAGGNAMDAAVTASAVLCVVEPQSTGIGGDCFVLYAPGGGGEVIAYNGSGRAPGAASAEALLDAGVTTIGMRSPHSVTIPGAIDAWARLLEDHGRLGLERALQPAIAYAEEGFAVHQRVGSAWSNLADMLSADENSARILLPAGKSPRQGDVHRLPELAAALRLIARDGRDGFYTGAIAEDLVSCLHAKGGVHTLDDFAAAKGEYVTPIRTAYGAYDVYECPPNGQGIVALIMLNILAGYDLGALDPLGVERLHLEIEACRLAFGDRDALIADPAMAEVPVDRLLSEEHAAAHRARISRDRAMAEDPPYAFADHPDTIYLCVVDRDRNAVSFINSVFEGFGSGITSPKYGVTLQNRGAGFVVEPGHPNCIAPGKRPMHTIIPGMALKDGRVAMPFGVMGGHYQPVGHVHLLTNIIDYGMDVQAALDFPRVSRYGEILELERGVPQGVADGLAALGHRIGRPDAPHGGGQAIGIDWQRGVLTGGSDPRKDGCALGY